MEGKMPIRFKICGLTREKDVFAAVKAGASAAGFVFYKKSPRYIGPFKARALIRRLPPFVTPVGVFVDAREGAVKDIAEFCGLRVLQFHGDETPTYCRRFSRYTVIKAFRVSGESGKGLDVGLIRSYPVAAWLFDTFSSEAYGGTGQTFPWKLLRRLKDFGKPLILSGGLTPANVAEAVREVRPFAVDVSSGVEERPGIKDADKMMAFSAALVSAVSD